MRLYGDADVGHRLANLQVMNPQVMRAAMQMQQAQGT